MEGRDGAWIALYVFGILAIFFMAFLYVAEPGFRVAFDTTVEYARAGGATAGHWIAETTLEQVRRF